METNKKIDMLVVTPINENCYLFHNGREAVVFDAGGDFEIIRHFLDSHGLKVKYILNTHGHFDHAGAVAELKKYTGAPFMIHQSDVQILEYGPENSRSFGIEGFIMPIPDKFLTDGEKIEFDGSIITVIHTPGHTPGGVSFLIEPELVLISGDTLFYESVGRTDFPLSNHNDIVKSITEKLYALPDNVIVYPGHGRKSTIGHEKINNPYIRAGR